MGRQFVARLLQPRQHGFQSRTASAALLEAGRACRPAALRAASAAMASSISTMTLVATAVQGDDGMEGGADARAAGHRRQQRGIEQEGPVVIDRDQHRSGSSASGPAARCTSIPPGLCAAGNGENIARQSGQGFRRAAQHIVRRGGGEQRVEEAQQVLLGASSARAASTVPAAAR